jgi:hypothetical protein
VSDAWSSPLPLIALVIYDVLSLFSVGLLRGFYRLYGKREFSHTTHEIVVSSIFVNLVLVVLFGIRIYLGLWPP